MFIDDSVLNRIAEEPKSGQKASTNDDISQDIPFFCLYSFLYFTRTEACQVWTQGQKVRISDTHAPIDQLHGSFRVDSAYKRASWSPKGLADSLL